MSIFSKKIIETIIVDGMKCSHCAQKVVDTLKKHNVKATFFIVGNYLKTKPELIKRMAEEGHIVGNHTYSHPDMSKISDFESFIFSFRASSSTMR